jgi:hypothetical protein
MILRIEGSRSYPPDHSKAKLHCGEDVIYRSLSGDIVISRSLFSYRVHMSNGSCAKGSRAASGTRHPGFHPPLERGKHVHSALTTSLGHITLHNGDQGWHLQYERSSQRSPISIIIKLSHSVYSISLAANHSMQCQRVYQAPKNTTNGSPKTLPTPPTIHRFQSDTCRADTVIHSPIISAPPAPDSQN